MICSRYPKIDTLYVRNEKFKVDTTQIRRPEFLIPRRWLVTEKIHGTNVRVSLESKHPETCAYVRAMTANGYELKPEAETDCGCESDWVMRFNGRKENSQMPAFLTAHLQDTFALEGLQHLWRGKKDCEGCNGDGWFEPADSPCSCFEPYSITLYGEGYGGGIQKGGGEYTSKTKGDAASFRLFDVLVGETWLRRSDVEDVAAKLGIKTVPLINRAFAWTLDSIPAFVRLGIESIVAEEEGTGGHMAEGIVAFTEEPLYNNRGQRLMFKLKTSDFA